VNDAPCLSAISTKMLVVVVVVRDERVRVRVVRRVEVVRVRVVKG